MINSEIDQNTRLEELERYAESLTLINEMSQLYNGTEEYDDIFKITASYTPRVLTSAARASITLLDEGGHTFSVFALQGNAAIPLGSRVPLENTAIGEAVGRKELVHENDLNSKDYSDYRLLQEGGLTSAMSMPLINGGKTLGTLNVASQVDFGWRDEKLLEKIGGLLSSSLSSRILFSKLQKAHDQIQKSINYAKRIQTAVLPSEDEIRKYLPESFVLYHPKDVVSGDFYWFSEKDGMIYLAVGDCTGHGVPGCLMSMLGANILSQLIREMKCDNTGSILCALDYRVKSMLSGSDKEVRVQDGMDITFCAIDTHNNTMRFASAKRPVILMRDGELEEIKGDKNPIGGGFYKSKNFNEHQIDLREDDIIYMYTDGITDQFGGPDFRKYGSRQFREVLAGLKCKDIGDHKIHLENEFLKWMGKREQTDDVLVLGLRPVFKKEK